MRPDRLFEISTVEVFTQAIKLGRECPNYDKIYLGSRAFGDAQISAEMNIWSKTKPGS